MLIFGNRSKKPDGFEFNTFSWKLRQRFEGMKKKSKPFQSTHTKNGIGNAPDLITCNIVIDARICQRRHRLSETEIEAKQKMKESNVRTYIILMVDQSIDRLLVRSLHT